MSFHEVRLPARLAFGSTGGVERRTEIVTLGSGFERRSTPWAQGRRRYLIGANLRSLDDMAALTGFFEARRGRLYGFRFRDFADFKSCAPGRAISATDQVLGQGDGVRTVFALLKRYGDDESPAHLRAKVRIDGGFDLSWIARSRIDGDRWDFEPASADPLRFRVRILAGTAALRTFEVDGVSALYSAANAAADFPSGRGPAATIAVSQWGEGYGWGAEAKTALG